jgi:hypothetical protein
LLELDDRVVHLQLNVPVSLMLFFLVKPDPCMLLLHQLHRFL